MTRALILGRFQPPHRGHLAVIEEASRRHDQVIVVVGSAQASYTPDNPFTAGERIEMLLAGLEELGVRNALLIPLADLNRHAEWVAYVESLVPDFDEVVTNNPLTRRLFGDAGYKVRAGRLVDRSVCRATRIRERILRGEPIDDAVPPAVHRVLRRLNAARRVRDLAAGAEDAPPRAR